MTGACYQGLRDYVSAIAAYKAGLDLVTASGDNHVIVAVIRKNLLDCYVAARDWNNAILLARGNVQAVPEKAGSWQKYVGDCYRQRGQYANAIESYKAGLEKSNDYSDVMYLNMALVWTYADFTNDYEAMLAQVHYMAGKYPKLSKWCRFWEGYYQMRTGDHAAALTTFKQVIQDNPNEYMFCKAHSYVAENMAELGDVQGAITFLDSFYADSPSRRPYALAFKAKVLRAYGGDPRHTIAVLQEFLATYPKDPLARERKLELAKMLRS